MAAEIQRDLEREEDKNLMLEQKNVELTHLLAEAENEVENLIFRLKMLEEEFGAVWDSENRKYQHPDYEEEDWDDDYYGEEEEEEEMTTMATMAIKVVETLLTVPMITCHLTIILHLTIMSLLVVPAHYLLFLFVMLPRT